MSERPQRTSKRPADPAFIWEDVQEEASNVYEFDEEISPARSSGSQSRRSRRVSHTSRRSRPTGRGSLRAGSRRGRGVRVPSEEQDPPEQMDVVPTTSRGPRGRGRRGGRTRVKRGGPRLSLQQVQQLTQFQNQRKEKIKDMVNTASRDFLERLVVLLADVQPGLTLDIMQALSSEMANEEAEHPTPAQSPEPQTPPTPQQEQPDPVQQPSPEQASPSTPRRPPTPPAPPTPPTPRQPPAQRQQDRPPQREEPDWCLCGHCEEMNDPIENVCCENREEFCISLAAEMNALILDEAVLLLQRLYRNDMFNLNDEQNDRRAGRAIAEERKRNRHAAYRQFVLWQYGRLGRGNRRVVPSCCVLAIRERYPDPDGRYVGFKFAHRLN